MFLQPTVLQNVKMVACVFDRENADAHLDSEADSATKVSDFTLNLFLFSANCAKCCERGKGCMFVCFPADLCVFK